MKVSEIISENSIAEYNSQKLILIDFWATWCGPCIPAAEQLEILQNTKKDKLFVLSISDEPAPVIQKFLLHHPLQLMVVSDYENYTFNKYSVTHRPFSVLINSEGKVLWKGHPAELKTELIDFFHLKISKVHIDKEMTWLNISEYTKKPVSKLSDKETVMIEEIKEDSRIFQIENNKVLYEGPIKELLLKIRNISSFGINMPENENRFIKLIANKSIWDNNPDYIFERVLGFCNLKWKNETREITGTQLITSNENLLWDTEQFKWNDQTNRFIIGADRVQADDLTLNELCNLLSEIKNKYYFYSGKNILNHDWDFNYLYDNLMIEEFESSFGIKFEEVKTKIKVYTIEKKE